MCAIIGALLNNIDSPDKASMAEEILTYIMKQSRARGRDGFGWKLIYDMGDNGKLTDNLKNVTRCGVCSPMDNTRRWRSRRTSFPQDPLPPS